MNHQSNQFGRVLSALALTIAVYATTTGAPLQVNGQYLRDQVCGTSLEQLDDNLIHSTARRLAIDVNQIGPSDIQLGSSSARTSIARQATTTTTPTTDVKERPGPSLYDSSDGMTILSRYNFDSFIYSNQTDHVSLVQFYNYHCPHCQGFAPHFRRFVRDVRHWRPLIRVGVLNCADSDNVQLCRDHEPQIRVPTIKWYAFGSLLLQWQLLHGSKVPNDTTLTVSHRKLIPEQRRDLVSLRRATVEFMDRLVAVRPHLDGTGELRSSMVTRPQALVWHLWTPRQATSVTQLLAHLDRLASTTNTLAHKCSLAESNTNQRHLSSGGSKRINSKRLDEPNLVALIVEPEGSYLGGQVVADWSDNTCPDRLFVVRTSEARLHANLLYYAIKNERALDGDIANLAIIDESTTVRLFIIERWSKQQQQQQERRFSVRLLVDDKANSTVNSNNSSDLNWNPTMYAHEERLRWRINSAIAAELASEPNGESPVPVPGHNPDDHNELVTTPAPIVVPSEHDDQASLMLTDYYKTLHQMLELEVLAKAQLDGYQMWALVRLLNVLGSYFPFERRDGSSGTQRFLLMARDTMSDELKRRVVGSVPTFDPLAWTPGGGSSESNSMLTANYRQRLERALNNVTVSSAQVSSWWRKIEQKCQCGIPSRDNFEWKYCAGSKPYLRGYTCGLWLLFHTLTVNEYQHSMSAANNKPALSDGRVSPRHVMINDRDNIFDRENRKSAKQNHSNVDYCRTEQPELDLYGQMTSAQKFVDSPYALASMVNFVRFFFGCDNCAGHFSCMVKRQYPFHPNGDWNVDSNQVLRGQHALWLWQAHNQVDVRTRGTHSEDPTHPKHVFPDAQICPCCYSTPPTSTTESAQVNGKNNTLKFDIGQFDLRRTLHFIMFRYESGALQHNRINIESSFKVPNATQPISSGIVNHINVPKDQQFAHWLLANAREHSPTDGHRRPWSPAPVMPSILAHHVPFYRLNTRYPQVATW